MTTQVYLDGAVPYPAEFAEIYRKKVIGLDKT